MNPTVINNSNNNSGSSSGSSNNNNCGSERQNEPQQQHQQQQPSNQQQQSHQQQQQPYFNYPLGSHPIGMTDFGFGTGPGFNFNEPDDDDDDMFYSRSRFIRDPWGGLGWAANRKRRGSLQDEAQPTQSQTPPQSQPTFETAGGRAGTRGGADMGDIFGRGRDIFSRYQPDWNMTWHPRMKRAQAPSPQPQPQPSAQGTTQPPHGAHPMSTDDDDYVGTIFDHIPAEFRRYFSRDFGFPSMRDHYKPTAHSSTDHVVPPTASDMPPRPAPAQSHFQQPQSAQPKYRDAAMQTDHSDEPSTPQSPTANLQAPNLNQHGLRNTMDMGQRSPNENPRTHRAHSAPPESAEEDQQQEQQQQQQQQPRQTFTYTSAQTHPTGSGSGGSAFASANAFATSGQPNQPPQSSRSTSTSTSTMYQPPQSQATQSTQATPMPPPPPGSSSGPQSPSMRTIPIRIESRKRADPQTQQQRPSQPDQPTADVQTDGPAPVGHPQEEATPPTRPPNESIHKIQEIQRDVLDLMYKVEKFAGLKNDKEYLYLDEMLTRNLLRLDDIDTQGNESIRLARKEAIKCIQASLTVLEAKAEGNKLEAGNSEALSKSDSNTNTNAESSQNQEAAEAADANNNNEIVATDCDSSSNNDVEMEKPTTDNGGTTTTATTATTTTNDITNMETGDVETATGC